MSGIKKRSISLNGHRTSYSIEDEFQQILQQMADQQSVSLAKIISNTDSARSIDTNLSSALRLAALSFIRSKAHE